MIPRAAKRDASEKSVVQTLQACGFSVLRLSVKDGPDLIACRQDVGNLLIEVKSGTRKLRPGQQRFADSWPRPVYLLRCEQDVLLLAKEITR